MHRKKLPSLCRRRALLLGKLDQMAQSYILAASGRGAVITTSMTVSTARALKKRYPDIFGNIDVENSHWVQSLYRRMGFKHRQAITSKPCIPEGARKEQELMFPYLIEEKAEE